MADWLPNTVDEQILWPPDSLFKMAAWVENLHISNKTNPASFPHNFTALSENETTIRATLVPILKRNMRIIVEDAVGVME